jgi:hypothetical protein
VFEKTDVSASPEEMMIEISSASRMHYYFTNYGGTELFRWFDYPGPGNGGLLSWTKAPQFLNWTYMTQPLPYNYGGELNDSISTNDVADTFSPVDLDVISIGARYNGGNPSPYNFREFLIYSRELTPTEINEVETYLKNKWNYGTW